MSSPGIDVIKDCPLAEKLFRLWDADVERRSKLPRAQVKELIRVKDEHGPRNSMPEEDDFPHDLYERYLESFDPACRQGFSAE